ncbi:YbaB/EbfC family nucleoid-associated protein [Nocardia sp. NPDC050175]|uniref:YbaB/EbfC family nucleoid-associated protein n=1 Tax=Nocardia sp. NPDC050175 TaxID=3364317 RepID=UPI00379D7E79
MSSPHDEVGIKILRAQQALAQIRGSARTGGVSIEVDSKGHLQGISIDAQAIAGGPSRLSALILHAYQQAVQDAEPRAASAMQELMDDPQVARVVDMTVQPDTPTRSAVQPTAAQSGAHEQRWATPTPAVDSTHRAPLSAPATQTSTGSVTNRSNDDWDEEEDDDYYARKQRQGWLEP